MRRHPPRLVRWPEGAFINPNQLDQAETARGPTAASEGGVGGMRVSSAGQDGS